MRTICTLLLLAGLALPLVGQQPTKKDPPAKDAPAKIKEAPKADPGSLEDTLDKVLRHSPEIKAAEAKVRDAETELFRVRHQMLSKVNTMFNELKIAKRMLELATKDYDTQVKRAAVDPNDPSLATYRVVIEKHRGEVERLETELKSLRGEFNLPANSVLRLAFTDDGQRLVAQDMLLRVWDLNAVKPAEKPAPKPADKPVVTEVAPKLAEKLDKLLKTEITMMADNNEARGILEGLLELSKIDIPLRVLIGEEEHGLLSLKGTITGRGWIQAIEESHPELVVVVRDYGLLLTTKKRIPAGAMRLLDYTPKPRG